MFGASEVMRCGAAMMAFWMRCFPRLFRYGAFVSFEVGLNWRGIDVVVFFTDLEATRCSYTLDLLSSDNNLQQWYGTPERNVVYIAQAVGVHDERSIANHLIRRLPSIPSASSSALSPQEAA